MTGINWHPCDPHATNDQDTLTIFYRDRPPATLYGQEAYDAFKAILRGAVHRHMTITFPDAASQQQAA